MPVHSPEIILGMNCSCCSRVPAVSSASIAPSVSSGQSEKLRFALLIISMHAAPIVFGRPWPPKSPGCCSPCQPPSPNCRNASLKPGVVVTTPSFHVDGWMSPSRLSGASTSPLKRAHSSSTACAVSSPASSKPGRRAIASRSASSFMQNSMSLTGAM